MIIWEQGCHVTSLTDLENHMKIIEDRHNNGSIIVTSQIPVQGWYDIIGEKIIADAILDRLIH